MSDPAQRHALARVVVCDSHFAIQKALERKIGSAADLEMVASCSSVEALSELLDRERADVLVLEIMQPGAVGIDLIRQTKAQRPELHVIVYTMYDEAIYGMRAIRAGASAYVMKRQGTRTVVKAIRAALGGAISPGHTALNRHRAPSPAVESRHPTNALTDDEMSVFQLLGEGNSIEDIAALLGRTRSDVRLLEQEAQTKLGFGSREALVQYAQRLVHR